MREKLEHHGREAFYTHELFEMLLYHCIPYRDTNPTAQRLIARFGSIDGVFSASESELLAVDGVGEKTAELIRAAASVNISDSSALWGGGAVRFDDYRTVGEFLLSRFKGVTKRRTLLLLLNGRMECISCVRIADSDFESGAIKPKDFIDAAVESRAVCAIIAHNHPFGPAFPTQGDQVTNNMISAALDKIGVMLLEHYVICGESYLGIMNGLSAAFSDMRKQGEAVKGGVGQDG